MSALNPRQRLSRTLRRIGIVALAVALVVVAFGIASRMLAEARLTAKTDEEAIATVTVIQPQQGLKNQTLVLPGDIQAYYEAPIYARVSGYLKEWREDIGAPVKAGQLLAEIDTPDLDQQLGQAQADLAAARSNAKLADLTSKRWRALVKTESVSQQETDEKSGDAEAKTADAGAAQANVNKMMALEAFKRIVAPFDGIVTARETDVGALISAGGGTGPELFRVADIHKMRIYVRVPQALSGGIAPGQIADMRLPQHPDKMIPATVATSSHAINQTSRTLLVELQVDNPDGALQPGTYAEVHFKLPDNPDILRLPTSALLFREDGLQVATVGQDARVALKPVTIGRDLGTEVEISSGLDASDRVINSPADSIAAGDVVRPADPSQTADAAAAGARP